MTTKTFSPRPRDIERHWYVVDADGAVLGRLASEVAKLLRGKHKPIFAPHMDTGDHVIVVNARGVRVTGGKEASKVYYRHSGFPGGIRALDYSRILSERPALAVEKAIRGMLPKNRLGRAMFKKLAVYEGPEHPHQAQQPRSLSLGEIPKWEGLPAPPPVPGPRVLGPGGSRVKRQASTSRKQTSAAKPPVQRGGRRTAEPAEREKEAAAKPRRGVRSTPPDPTPGPGPRPRSSRGSKEK